MPGHFLAMDPPAHTRLRRLVAAEFSAGRIDARRPQITDAVGELVRQFAAGPRPADLVAAVAVPLPAMTASEMLGTPLGDREFFMTCARDLQVHDATVAQRVAAAGRMTRYLEGLISRKRRDPGDDVLSRLAAELDRDPSLSLAELVGVVNLVIVAGLETTAGLVSLATLSLLTDPAQFALVRSNPVRWARPAVVEALRFWTVVQHGVARVATRDVTVAGRLIHAGDAVIVSLASANRDPAVYPEADRFDITRDARQQIAFGHGVHRCLGSFVAEVQAELTITELVSRLPGLRLDEAPDRLTFLDDMLVYGLRELPVDW
ncbi:cytochrome P450 [Micromonospora sp. HUAS YX12]|uniref:Cytochrome P450 n=1 Tax=Micromonospora sp. HUAS YX12 TaxID=3156396 RepID=A0AAU7R3G2_9ACTN